MTKFAFPLDDKAVDEHIAKWIHEAGGKISLRNLEKKFFERFRFDPWFAIGEEVDLLKKGSSGIFRLEGGMVRD